MVKFRIEDIAVLREAVDRADAHASAQAQLIQTQRELIVELRERIRSLDSELGVLRGAIR